MHMAELKRQRSERRAQRKRQQAAVLPCEVRQLLEEKCDGLVERVTCISSLWQGYGHVYRVGLHSGRSLVVKHIHVTGARDPKTETRIKSYDVEVTALDGLVRAGPVLPELVAVYRATDGAIYICMSDLLSTCPLSTVRDEAASVVRDLAIFHAANIDAHVLEGLWTYGTFWALDKRQAELENMEANWRNFLRECGDGHGLNKLLARRLRVAAPAIFKRLTGVDPPLIPSTGRAACQNPRWTAVHGDCKSENMLFGAKSMGIYDLQWSGGGLGVQDLVYYLHCNCEDVAEQEGTLSRLYLDTFVKSHPYSLTDFQCDFEVALLDLVRFMLGFRMGLFFSDYLFTLRNADRILLQADGGKVLSAMDYADHL
ncbi:MAG: uncharacterized protein KVP18_000424 [Porospora cf. gigantea A]|uniref:uncharacterized protein n=1 Tax=Porospora cf. gigantea A TaxID=2853593 RepID=UPI00355AA019|nr:MAG: hypothetical protein KVP18_000424 [Porospora cf. gigantea A]